MTTSGTVQRDLRVVVMGAGMAGILSGIKRKQAGFTSVTIYEIAAEPSSDTLNQRDI